MRSTYSQLYLHLVWATWNRLPLITPELRPHVYNAIDAQCTRMGAEVFAIGGVADHVHLLVRFPATVAVSDLVGRAKGGSSHLVMHELRWPDPFKWQGAYGAFTLSKRSLPHVRDYVLRQEEHHRAGTLLRALEPAPAP